MNSMHSVIFAISVTFVSSTIAYDFIMSAMPAIYFVVFCAFCDLCDSVVSEILYDFCDL